MSIAAPRQLLLPNQVLQRNNVNLLEVLESVIDLPLLQGQLATVALTQALAAGTYFLLNHGLGRALQGVLPCAVPYKALKTVPSSPAFFLGPATSSPDLTANLACSVALVSGPTLTFWVF